MPKGGGVTLGKRCETARTGPLRACHGLGGLGGWNENPAPAGCTQPTAAMRSGLGVRGALPDADAPGRPATRPRPARGLRRPAPDRARQRALAPAANRLPAVGSGLPANAAVDRGGVLRGDDPRRGSAPTAPDHPRVTSRPRPGRLEVGVGAWSGSLEHLASRAGGAGGSSRATSTPRSMSMTSRSSATCSPITDRSA